MEAQHSIEWFRKRLGNFTGSQVGLLMKKGRTDYFSATAKTYIYQVASERDMNPEVVNDDVEFDKYLHQVCINTKSMQWGTDQEENARELYERITGRHIVETGSCKHPTIEYFASSPDGYYYDEETGEKGCLEIKCPIQSTFMKYRSEIYDSESLLDTKPEYFYQCMAHMMCTGAQWTDFVVYNPFQNTPIHIVRILPDETVFAEMEKRIHVANDVVKELIEQNDVQFIDKGNSAPAYYTKDRQKTM